MMMFHFQKQSSRLKLSSRAILFARRTKTKTRLRRIRTQTQTSNEKKQTLGTR